MSLNINNYDPAFASGAQVQTDDIADASVTPAKLSGGVGVALAATTAAYAGGGTSNAYTATGLLSTDIVIATILASTNSVAIAKAVPTANTLTVTFTADPGAGTTVSYVAVRS